MVEGHLSEKLSHTTESHASKEKLSEGQERGEEGREWNGKDGASCVTLKVKIFRLQ